MNKIKVLCLFDYACSTGFAQVSKNIIQNLDKTGDYDFTIIGINYDPGRDIDFTEWPGNIKPAVTVADMHNFDVYGRRRFLEEVAKCKYDIIFIIQDTFIIQTIIDNLLSLRDEMPKKFSTIFYYPFDATPKKEWVEKCVSLFDFPVAYTNYAKKLTLDIDADLKNKLRTIYHGTNLKDFYYIKDRQEVADFRKKYFMGEADGSFIITNVNRNQPRKNVFANFQILNELRKRGHDNAKLYLHMAANDEGGNLLVMADYYGFRLGKDYIIPNPKVFEPNRGLPIEVVNQLYNASDMVLSTTLGEGWGLSITEAMATRTPVVAPDNTSLTEMLADNRGYLVPSNALVNLGGQDNERARPLIDIQKATDAIEKIMAGKLPDIQGAYEWAQHNSWENICQEWRKVFVDAYNLTRKLDEESIRTANGTMSRQQRRALEREQRKANNASL